MRWSSWVTSGVLAVMPKAWAGGAVPTPDRRGANGPDRSFDLEHVALDVTIDPDAGSLEGRATYTVRRLFPGFLTLDEVALDIETVQVDGALARWWTRGDTLVIDVGDLTEPQTDPARASARVLVSGGTQAAPTTAKLAAEPKAGGSATGRPQHQVTVTWKATPRTGLHFRRAGRGSPDRISEVWSQGERQDNRYWFPGWDHPNDRFDLEAAVRVTGHPDWKVLTNSGHDMVNYLVMVAAGPYQVRKLADHPEVEVWLPPGTSDDVLARVLAPIPDMMAHFEARTGVPYAWGSYRQVFVQRFLYSGMENTSATVETANLLVDDRVADTRGEGVYNVVAHELAHQWFGDLLTCRSWRDLWLNEGFATFMAADWMAAHLGGAGGAADYAESVRTWFTDSLADEALAGRFYQGDHPADNHNVYSKGASVLQMLRVLLGEVRFWDGIRRYTKAHAHGLVETRDLRRAMEEASGQDLGWFFEQWVGLPVVPHLTVTQRYDGDALTVTVKQEVAEDRPPFTLPIEVEVGTPGGPKMLHAWLDRESVDLSAKLGAPPAYVAFDPRGAVLAKVEQHQDPAAWEAQLSSPAPYARRVAIEALGKTDHSSPLAALLADPHQPRAIRTACARALGEQHVVTPLVPAVRDADGAVRREVARALGQAVRKEGDPDPARLLRRLATADPNPDVRAAALEALARLDEAAALELARSDIRCRDLEERLLCEAAVRVLGEHGVPADLGRLLDPRAPGRLRTAAALAAARLVSRQDPGHQRERLRERVARFTELLLDDLDVRTRQAAIGVLAQVGDRRTVDHLEAYERVETVKSLKKAAEKAVETIQARKPSPEAKPNETQARLDAIEERLDALEAQLDQLAERH